MPRNIFYGAAIQGNRDRRERSVIHRQLLDVIRSNGFDVYSEHTGSDDYSNAMRELENAIGPLPPKGPNRTRYIRDRMIAGIEANLVGAVFECSTPSLGTGIELAHAYLRGRMGLQAIPILVLYQTDYWPSGLSSMIRGAPEELDLTICDYADIDEAQAAIVTFLERLD